MLKNEHAYLDMLKRIITDGLYRKPEDEEGRFESFTEMLRFDLTRNQIPIMTTKKIFTKSAFGEMLWFLSGDQDTKLLKEMDIKIWDLWSDEQGNVGPLYGHQWRHWAIDPRTQKYYGGATEIDQIAQVIKTLGERPEARSHMVTAWRPDHLKLMSIKPCHILLQFYRFGDEISLTLYQRSCDAYLGVPFNIAQYSLLTHMVAHQLGCTAKEFVWIGGDVHVYENHLEQVRTQLERFVRPAPVLRFVNKPDNIFSYKLDDFEVLGYEHSDYVPAVVSPQGQPGKGIRLD